MSIEKFVPLSPDPNLNVGADMTVARFGHLNKLVDEINAGGGGGGGGGVIDVGEGTASTIRINTGNQAFGIYGSALSGLNNITCNEFTANTWGRNNCAVGCYSSVNGVSNIVVARNSHILSGTNNTIACNATQGAWNNFTSSSYSGNYFQAELPTSTPVPVMACACILRSGCDLTSKWNAGDTFSGTYSYAYGVTGTGSCCYTQFQMANVEVVCAVYTAPWTYLYFCYDPTSPNWCGSYRPDQGGITYSFGYLQKTGSFSSYSTYGASYHPNLITGGAFNTINAYTSGATISGGYQNTISNGYASIHGGSYNIIDNGGDIFGGRSNKSCQGWNSLISGSNNVNCCSFNGFIVGQTNCALNSSIQTLTGVNNHLCNQSNYTSIIGGVSNRVINNSNVAGIFASCQSCIDTSVNASILGSVNSCILSSPYSNITGVNGGAISCGCFNTISSGCNNFISGGGSLNSIFGLCNIICTTSAYSNNNHIIGAYNTILGDTNNNIIGCTNYIPLNCIHVNIFGHQITADRNCATFVNNLSIKSIPTSSAGLPAGSVWNDGGFLKIV